MEPDINKGSNSTTKEYRSDKAIPISYGAGEFSQESGILSNANKSVISDHIDDYVNDNFPRNKTLYAIKPKNAGKVLDEAQLSRKLIVEDEGYRGKYYIRVLKLFGVIL